MCLFLSSVYSLSYELRVVLSTDFQANTSGAASSEVPSYVKERQEVDTSAIREERLAEVGGWEALRGYTLFAFFCSVDLLYHIVSYYSCLFGGWFIGFSVSMCVLSPYSPTGDDVTGRQGASQRLAGEGAEGRGRRRA
jgi:hypothetical protein